MEIYDEHDHPLETYDPELGYLREETRTTRHEAVEAVPERGHYETEREYPETGGKDVKWVVDEPGVEGREAYDEQRTVYVYVPYTEEELQAREQAKKDAERAALRQTQTMAAGRLAFIALAERGDVPEAVAAKLPAAFDPWAAGEAYEIGQLREHGGQLYKCRKQHTSQAGWEPDKTPALWALVDAAHAGTADDPIPYGSGMELTEGKYYAQDGVTYRCTRSTGQPVYNALSELVGLYVERAEA